MAAKLSRAGLRDCGTTDCGLPPSAEDTAMPPTRGKKRSSRDTQKQNVNEPREGATRVVTVASGHQKGQKKMQKLQHTPGGANLAWANEPCTKCTGSKRCQNCKDQMKMAISKARQKGKKAAAAAAAAEEEEEEEEQEEKGELERRAETLEIGTPGERAKLRSHDLKARRRPFHGGTRQKHVTWLRSSLREWVHRGSQTSPHHRRQGSPRRKTRIQMPRRCRTSMAIPTPQRWRPSVMNFVRWDVMFPTKMKLRGSSARPRGTNNKPSAPSQP